MKVSHSGLTPLFSITLIQIVRLQRNTKTSSYQNIPLPKPLHTKIPRTKTSSQQILHITKYPRTKNSSYKILLIAKSLVPKLPHNKTSLYQIFLISKSPHTKISSWVCLRGPVIQVNGRLTFEDDLRSGGLLCFTTQ